MLSAGLLFLLFNILEMVSTTRTGCNPSVGTFPDQDTVLNELAKLIEEKVKGALYSCALEPPTYLKYVQIGEENWKKVYPNLKYTRELQYSTQDENTSEDLEGLAKKAVEQWSDDLKEVHAKYFGCVVNKPSSGTTSVFCIFQ